MNDKHNEEHAFSKEGTIVRMNRESSGFFFFFEGIERAQVGQDSGFETEVVKPA